jgi:hypothetical protein
VTELLEALWGAEIEGHGGTVAGEPRGGTVPTLTTTRLTLFTVVDARVYAARQGIAVPPVRWRLFETLAPVARAA